MRVRRWLVCTLCAVLLMLALPTLCFFARNTGPAARVSFYDYLPLPAVAFYLLAMLVGAISGVNVGRALLDRGPQQRARRSWKLQLVGMAVLVPGLLLPTLQSFPAHKSLAVRDGWAREHVRHYAALCRVVAALPAVRNDVGRVRGIAPASSFSHTFAREMDGDDMRFELEVLGDRGRGTFQATCTLDDDRVYDWRPSVWRFAGREVHVDAVPDRVPAP